MERWTNAVAQQRSSQYYFYCYLSQRSKDHHTKWDSRLFPHHQRASEKFMIQERIFSTAVCFQCRLCGCFPSTVRQRGIPTWVALKLQSIMCDRGSVTTMQSWQYTHTQPCALNHRCIHTLTSSDMCMSTFALSLLILTVSSHEARRDGKRTAVRFSGCKTHRRICNPSIWEHADYYYSVSWVSAGMQRSLEKKRKGVKQITPEEPSGARTEIYFELEQSLQCCCSVLDAQVYSQFHTVICQRKTNDAVAAMKTIISE